MKTLLLRPFQRALAGLSKNSSIVPVGSSSMNKKDPRACWEAGMPSMYKTASEWLGRARYIASPDDSRSAGVSPEDPIKISFAS